MGSVLKDRYVVEVRLGGTGAGTVFKATDRLQRDEANRIVAIKIVQQGGDSRPERLSSLRREYYRTLSLCHESIVKVHELDQADGAAFFTMEFVDGKPLSQVIKLWSPRHIPRPDAWRIIAKLSAALAHVHARSIVHGDLHPQNVMVTRTGELRILDFGTSRLCGGRRSRIGTPAGGAPSSPPAYSCWEALDGRPADPRDDVYSLGCIAYELLAGVHPFQRRQADRARDRRPKIDSPPGLTRRQWQTLRAALSTDAESRPLSAAEWFSELQAGQASTRLLLSGPSMSIAHLHQKKPLPSWIVVPVIGVLVTLSILSSIHDRSPTSASTTQGEASAVMSSPAAGAGSAPPDAAPAPDLVAGAGSAAPQIVQASRHETAQEVVRATKSAGNIVIPERSYSLRPLQDFAEIRVHRAAASAGGVRFNWWTEPASAKPGTDFVPQDPVTRYIPPGSRAASLFIKVLPNSARKGSETFYVDVADSSDGSASPAISRVAVVLPQSR